jgi:hypothetical protein
MTSKVIILTGASRGIGLAIAEYLLRSSQRLILVARSAEPLENLKKRYPGQVEVLATDLADLSVCSFYSRSINNQCAVFDDQMCSKSSKALIFTLSKTLEGPFQPCFGFNLRSQHFVDISCSCKTSRSVLPGRARRCVDNSWLDGLTFT